MLCVWPQTIVCVRSQPQTSYYGTALSQQCRPTIAVRLTTITKSFPIIVLCLILLTIVIVEDNLYLVCLCLRVLSLLRVAYMHYNYSASVAAAHTVLGVSTRTALLDSVSFIGHLSLYLYYDNLVLCCQLTIIIFASESSN